MIKKLNQMPGPEEITLKSLFQLSVASRNGDRGDSVKDQSCHRQVLGDCNSYWQWCFMLTHHLQNNRVQGTSTEALSRAVRSQRPIENRPGQFKGSLSPAVTTATGDGEFTGMLVYK